MEIVQNCKEELEKAGAKGVDIFIQKLVQNRLVKENFEDLLLEGRAALALLEHGFLVNMQDAPDLHISFEGLNFFAEVKHFREKEQDRIDRVNVSDPNNETLVPFGNTLLLESSNPWDQVVRVAENKIKKYIHSAPYILIIGSDSEYCISSIEVPTAINILMEKVSRGEVQELKKLCGILFIDMQNWSNPSNPGNISFFPVFPQALTTPVHRALDTIKWG